MIVMMYTITYLLTSQQPGLIEWFVIFTYQDCKAESSKMNLGR